MIHLTAVQLTPPSLQAPSRQRQNTFLSPLSVEFSCFKIKPAPLSSSHHSVVAADDRFPLKPHAAMDDGRGDGDAAEWKKVAELRAVAVARDPASKEEDNFTLRRFLRTRGHNIGKASAMLLKYLAWKRAIKPRGFISDDEVHNQLAQEKVYTQGFDKMGRPMVYLFAARHFPRRDFDELKRYVVYVLDKTCARMPTGQEKFVAVVDLKGWGYANCDIKASLAGLDIIKNYYPEQLGQVFMVHVPFVFMAAWKLGCTFVDNNTKKKFVFIDDRDLNGTLRDVVDESQLPEVYGGKFKLQGYDHSSPPPSTCN